MVKPTDSFTDEAIAGSRHANGQLAERQLQVCNALNFALQLLKRCSHVMYITVRSWRINT